MSVQLKNLFANQPVSTTMNGVSGGPRALLRIEAGLVLIAALFTYHGMGGDWGLFALLFLLPDLSMLAYLVNPRVGAASYNFAHNYALALVICGLGVALAMPLLVQCGLIWIGHVGFDRALGYGLKYASAFGDTHLGRIGRAG